MSIRATVDGQNYNGITTINAGGKSIALTEQGTITTPTQTKNIDTNGTYDVTNFAQAIVNVPTSSGGGVTVHPLACKVVDIVGTETELDLTDLYSVDNMAQIFGVRIDGQGLASPTSLIYDYSAYAFYYHKSGNFARVYATKNGNTLENGSGSYYTSIPDDMTGKVTLGTYGKKAMKGQWLFVATAS